MPAYYNEHDKYAAQWLRNLIDDGLIAPGDVDDRSIHDVSPADLDGYTQCHFFAGIGVWSHALRGAGWPDDREVWTGSCPCQPFSQAGRGAGVEDDRHLWPYFHYLIQECAPAVVFGEQVASKAGLAWFDAVQADLEASRYAIGAFDLCAAGVGAPHLRQRLFFVADARGKRRSPGRGRGEGTGSREGVAAQRLLLTGEVAHAARDDQRRLREGRASGPEQDRRRCPASDVGHADGQHTRRHTRAGVTAQGQYDGGPSGDGASAPSPVRDVADADGGDASEARAECSRQHRQLKADGRPRELGHPDGFRQNPEPLIPHRTGALPSRDTPPEPPGPTNGHWRAADWLLCRDGRWRAVSPGSQPLADGAPARVGRLRAYGNAIVAPLAETFIRAFINKNSPLPSISSS